MPTILLIWQHCTTGLWPATCHQAVEKRSSGSDPFRSLPRFTSVWISTARQRLLTGKFDYCELKPAARGEAPHVHAGLPTEGPLVTSTDSGRFIGTCSQFSLSNVPVCSDLWEFRPVELARRPRLGVGFGERTGDR